MAEQSTIRTHCSDVEWLSPAELAAWLRVPIGTVYSWRQRKTGPPAHRIGGHLRYRLADIEAWLAERVA